jgi:solute carrier family 36 (proton-coupled amino acid transporter)
MSSPTRPVNIASPRSAPLPAFGTPSSRRGPGSRGSPSGTPYNISATGTPDLRSLRAQYIGTPTLPNIPPRTGTPRPTVGTPSTEPLVLPGAAVAPRPVPSISGITARRPTGVGLGLGLGLDDAPPPDPTIDIDSFPEDDKVKVLRKHLVSREERQANDGPISRKSSSSQLTHQEDPEAFPVPYHTPGADITYVRRKTKSLLIQHELQLRDLC